MAENNSDLYERQLLIVFESCLINGENELDENGLFSICNKLHLDGLIEELKSCICKQYPDKQTISFSEFRNGLLLLLKKSQGLMSDKQHIMQSYYNLNTICNADEKNEDLSLINSISKVHPQDIKTAITMDEDKLIRLWENMKVYLKENADPTTMRFISSCLGIPELPKQITESIFERLDQNCDGLIGFDEFVIIFQKTSIETRRRNNESTYNGVVNCNVNTLDFNASREITSLEINKSLDKEEVAGVSNVIVLSSSGDLNILDASLTELTNIICDELKNLNESLDNDTIQSHISLLREIVVIHQDEQRNLNVTIENIRAEKEKMRVDMLEANERANALAQEIDEYQVQLEKTKKNLQKQNEQRYIEITKELSNQLNIEREIDAATLKSKDDQLQMLQKENHEMKNKVVNMLQENQILEAENKILLSEIEKLRQSNNNLLVQIKVLDAEHDEIQDIEAKQQEQVNFFVERIKQLQSEVTLLRDQNDELGVELENFKHYGNKNTKDDALPSLACDLHLNEKHRNEKHMMQESKINQQVHASVQFDLESSMNEQQIDISVCNWMTEYEKFIKDMITNLENILLTNTKCIPENCTLRDDISRLIISLQSNFVLHSVQDFEKNIASELDTECEERINESLRDLVVSKIPKLACTKRITTISNSIENINEFSGQDMKTLTQNKMISLRDYPPRKEEHSIEQCKASKEKNNSLNIIENIEQISKIIPINTELLEIEKKQLIERCQELERSLDLLKVEYEECEDYWAAKLEEERQLFEQEQKMSDDKLAELINKIAEYEELISPTDKSKNNGRLSPIEEKFNLEQQVRIIEILIYLYKSNKI
jgi:ninein